MIDDLSILKQAATADGVGVSFCFPGLLIDLERRGLIARRGIAPAWCITPRGREYLASNEGAS